MAGIDVRFTARNRQWKAMERALSRMPRKARREVERKRAGLTRDIVGWTRQDAKAEGRQAAIIPVTSKGFEVVAGGNKRVGHSHGGRRRRVIPAWKLVFGSEFGARTLRQYKPHLGNGSYWFWKAVEKRAGIIQKRVDEIARSVIRDFTRGG